mgnify:CR=1 FL=1
MDIPSYHFASIASIYIHICISLSSSSSKLGYILEAFFVCYCFYVGPRIGLEVSQTILLVLNEAYLGIF